MEVISLEPHMDKNIKKSVTSRLDLLMDSLTKFFNETSNIDKMLPIVQGSSKISLRILDWFVTNYCKKNNVVIDSLKDKMSKKMRNIGKKYSKGLNFCPKSSKISILLISLFLAFNNLSILTRLYFIINSINLDLNVT